MMVEVGDMSEVGEAWVRYQGTRCITDFAELSRHAARADVGGVLRPERSPELVEFYRLPVEQLGDGYSVGGCWVFRVAPASLVDVAGLA